MNEEWRSVVGHEGLYEISDQGRVRSLERVVPCGRHFKRIPTKIRKLVTTGPYATLKLSAADGTEPTVYVHELVLTAFVGPRPDGLIACHGPGGAYDNSVTNLRWDTPSENNYDSVRFGNHHWAHMTTCKRGHRLIEPNLCTGDLQRGWRRCLSCHNARNRVWREGGGDVDKFADEYYRAMTLREDWRDRLALEPVED